MASTQKRTLTPSWDLASKSVRLIRSHFTPFMYIILLPSLLYTFGALLNSNVITPEGKVVLDNIHPQGLAIMGIALLWTLVNLGPATHFELSATKHGPKLIGTYYKDGLKDTFRLAVQYILIGIAVTVGLLLLIVPGLILLRMFLLAPFYAIDKKLPIVQAMKLSAKNSKPFSGYIWGIVGVQIAITFAAGFLGSIPFVGAAISQIMMLSITFLAALRYRTIEG